MDRREFLAVSTVSLSATTHAVRPGPLVVSGQLPDVAVIGAGAFGVWTALSLRERGHAVTLIDAYGPGNSRATSGDETRQVRAGYGDRALYAQMAFRAQAAWKEREREFGIPLLTETGRLELATDWTASMRATQATLQRLGVAHRAFTQDDLRRRYPQMRFDDVGVGLLEVTAGVVRAKQAIIAAGEAFVRKGGTLTIDRARPGRAAGRVLSELELAGGARVSAAQFVFACGPWLPRVFPELLRERIKTPGRDVFYFGLPAGDTRFLPSAMPNFSEAGYYGFPSIDGRGVKVCPTTGSADFDPDTDERIVSSLELRRARAYLARRMPALASQPITETRVCQLENTADEHFIVDRHPAWDNVLIAGGGSGHAFKHGPILGEYVGQRAIGAATDPAFDQMVRLART